MDHQLAPIYQHSHLPDGWCLVLCLLFRLTQALWLVGGQSSILLNQIITQDHLSKELLGLSAQLICDVLAGACVQHTGGAAPLSIPYIAPLCRAIYRATSVC